MSGPDRFDLTFVGIGNEDTLLIYVRYLPRVNREVMNIRIEGAKQYIEDERKNRGWPWLKIREDVKMQELPAK